MQAKKDSIRELIKTKKVKLVGPSMSKILMNKIHTTEKQRGRSAMGRLEHRPLGPRFQKPDQLQAYDEWRFRVVNGKKYELISAS